MTVGMVFPALRGASDGFTLLAFEPVRFLVPGWMAANGRPLVTWAVVLTMLGGLLLWKGR